MAHIELETPHAVIVATGGGLFTHKIVIKATGETAQAVSLQNAKDVLISLLEKKLDRVMHAAAPDPGVSLH
ncbi:MAG: hypothetical protein AAFQ79_19165 [Pseudomonadota bacterium]